MVEVFSVIVGPAWQEVYEVAALIHFAVFVQFFFWLVPGGHLDSVVRLEFFQVGPYFLEWFSH